MYRLRCNYLPLVFFLISYSLSSSKSHKSYIFIVSKISFSVPSKPLPASGIASRASAAGSDFWIPSADTPVQSYVNVSTSRPHLSHRGFASPIWLQHKSSSRDTNTHRLVSLHNFPCLCFLFNNSWTPPLLPQLRSPLLERVASENEVSCGVEPFPAATPKFSRPPIALTWVCTLHTSIGQNR